VDPLAYTDDAPQFSPEVLARLSAPVDPELVETRATTKDGPEKLVYVPWVHYQAVLLAAFGPGGYRLVPRGVPRTEGNVITWTGALFVRAPGASKFQFIKEAKGECGMHGGMTIGNAAEGAQSDCLVKCCKALGIFMELFDPRWRRAWEAKYRPQHEQEKRKAAWPAARNGGPVPTASASGASPPAAMGGPAGSSATTAAAPAASTASPGSPGDPGEPATDEQKAAIVGQIRALKLMKNYVRAWVNGLFPDIAVTTDNPIEALSKKQADAAFLLLSAHGKQPMYDNLLVDLRAAGDVA
jgi:hypothetical protein